LPFSDRLTDLFLMGTERLKSKTFAEQGAQHGVGPTLTDRALGANAILRPRLALWIAFR
jgi:hypothetical protein